MMETWFLEAQPGDNSVSSRSQEIARGVKLLNVPANKTRSQRCNNCHSRIIQRRKIYLKRLNPYQSTLNLPKILISVSNFLNCDDSLSWRIDRYLSAGHTREWRGSKRRVE